MSTTSDAPWSRWWAHTTADMQIIPKFTLFFSGWWIEVACVGIYWELLGQGKWQSCDFAHIHSTWIVEGRVQVRLGFDNIQYFQCSSLHHFFCASLPTKPHMWNACTGSIFHVCDCSATSLNSQFEWGKPISLRCMRKGSVESVMLEAFELCILTWVYSEDLVSEKTSAARCFSISFIYVSADENANTIIKLFRKHVMNIYLIYFFLLKFCITQCVNLSHMLTIDFFFLLLL